MMMFRFGLKRIPSVRHLYHTNAVTLFDIDQESKKLNHSNVKLSSYLPDKIRNFGIIAHVDHGKSTIADRLLELTGVIEKEKDNQQVLDTLSIEKERGITVKAQTCTLFYHDTRLQENYMMNLIDTPGHVDFSYEVSRSLAACQGVLLVVDAAQGVQAQTLANFYLAFGADLAIIPVINKIDLPNANVEKVQAQMMSLFEFEKDQFILTSAKSGIGMSQLLPTIIDRIPSPPNSVTAPSLERKGGGGGGFKKNFVLKSFLFDSWFTTYRGVCLLVEIVEGHLSKGDTIQSVATSNKYEVADVGILNPSMKSTDALYHGQVGYILCNAKSSKDGKIGDTFYFPEQPVLPLPGFKDPEPVVYSGIFPVDASMYERVKDNLDKLLLSDPSVTVANESSAALGNGWRLGFFGSLHMEVFVQRLEADYDSDVIKTAPTVPYRVTLKDGTIEHVSNPGDFPADSKDIASCEEPLVDVTLLTPEEYSGKLIVLCERMRGSMLEHTYIDDERAMLKYRLPLSEVAVDFFNQVKSITSGFASVDYDEAGFQEVSVSKIDISINGENVDVLTSIVVSENAKQVARDVCVKLKNALKRQQIEIVIQGKVGSKILAKEGLKAFRKDVTAKCYGGDATRRKKLLDRQKEGKKQMKEIGRVSVPKEAFISVLNSKS